MNYDEAKFKLAQLAREIAKAAIADNDLDRLADDLYVLCARHNVNPVLMPK